MGLAWKDRFFSKFVQVTGNGALLKSAQKHMGRWRKQMESGIKCDAEFGYYPSFNDWETARNELVPSLLLAMDTWEAIRLADGTGGWPVKCNFDGEDIKCTYDNMAWPPAECKRCRGEATTESS